MHKANGYVVAATPVPVPARVESIIVPKALYKVTETFGNKIVYFDPKDGKSSMSKTIDGVIDILKECRDIRNLEGVIEDFTRQYWYTD